MTDFFQFEIDFVDSLRCIPMSVRMKLDTCGVKLKLSHWNQLSQQERQILVTMPCVTIIQSQAYHDLLQNLVKEKTGAPASELTVDTNFFWMDTTVIPDDILAKAAEFDVSVTLSQWEALTPLQRFALGKLSRPTHENVNFLPALQEFGLASKNLK